MKIPQNFVRHLANTCKPKKSKKCSPASGKPKKCGAPIVETIVGPSGTYPPLEGDSKLWRNVTLFVFLPIVLVYASHVFTGAKHHTRPPYLPFEYLYIRTKLFPWCGGTEKSLFHNPKLNALPNYGYEEDLDD